jgi:hypothetical protein
LGTSPTLPSPLNSASKEAVAASASASITAAESGSEKTSLSGSVGVPPLVPGRDFGG